jgi:hypothetical protein
MDLGAVARAERPPAQPHAGRLHRQLLGTVVQRLRRTGMYDCSLLVVTADHGLAFTPGEQGRARVTDGTAPDVLWVPMFIKRPGQRTQSVTDVNMENVDLLPTIADIAGIRVPWSIDGVSWADPSAAKRLRTQKWFYPTPGTRRVLVGHRRPGRRPARPRRPGRPPPGWLPGLVQGRPSHLLRPGDNRLQLFLWRRPAASSACAL